MPTTNKAADGAHTRGNGTSVASRLAHLEDEFAVFKTNCEWVAAEQAQQISNLATAFAALLARQMQPDMERAMRQQILGGGT